MDGEEGAEKKMRASENKKGKRKRRIDIGRRIQIGASVHVCVCLCKDV